MLAKCSPEEIKKNEREADDWRAEIKRLQGLMATEAKYNAISGQEIPMLMKEIEDLKKQLSEAGPVKEKVCTPLIVKDNLSWTNMIIVGVREVRRGEEGTSRIGEAEASGAYGDKAR
jgi:hypothetical protein